MAFHKLSAAAWSLVATRNEKARLRWNAGLPFNRKRGLPSTVNSSVSLSPCVPAGLSPNASTPPLMLQHSNAATQSCPGAIQSAGFEVRLQQRKAFGRQRR